MPEYDLRVRVTTESTTDPAGALMAYLDRYSTRWVNGVQIDSIDLIGPAEPDPAAGFRDPTTAEGVWRTVVANLLTEIRDLLTSRL